VSWIDERIEEKRRLEERKQIVLVKAGSLFAALWNEIARCVTEAAQKGIPAAISVAAGNHVVYVPSKGGAFARKEITLSLPKDRTSIAIAGSPVRKLDIDRSEGDGDGVGLKRDGKQISIPDAAVLLLDPLIFADLPAHDVGAKRPVVTIER